VIAKSDAISRVDVALFFCCRWLKCFVKDSPVVVNLVRSAVALKLVRDSRAVATLGANVSSAFNTVASEL